MITSYFSYRPTRDCSGSVRGTQQIYIHVYIYVQCRPMISQIEHFKVKVARFSTTVRTNEFPWAVVLLSNGYKFVVPLLNTICLYLARVKVDRDVRAGASFRCRALASPSRALYRNGYWMEPRP